MKNKIDTNAGRGSLDCFVRKFSRSSDTDLGIAVAWATTPPGSRRTLEEIAAFCDVGKSTIYMIEVAALRKLRKALMKTRDPELRELLAEVFPHIFPNVRDERPPLASGVNPAREADQQESCQKSRRD